MLSYRRNERKRGKPGFSPRLTRAKNAWKVLSSRRSTSWQQEKLASPINPSARIGFQLVCLVVVVDALAAHFPSVAPFEAHLVSFLAFDVFAHHGFACRADGASVIAAA